MSIYKYIKRRYTCICVLHCMPTSTHTPIYTCICVLHCPHMRVAYHTTKTGWYMHTHTHTHAFLSVHNESKGTYVCKWMQVHSHTCTQTCTCANLRTNTPLLNALKTLKTMNVITLTSSRRSLYTNETKNKCACVYVCMVMCQSNTNA